MYLLCTKVLHRSGNVYDPRRSAILLSTVPDGGDEDMIEDVRAIHQGSRGGFGNTVADECSLRLTLNTGFLIGMQMLKEGSKVGHEDKSLTGGFSTSQSALPQ